MYRLSDEAFYGVNNDTGCQHLWWRLSERKGWELGGDLPPKQTNNCSRYKREGWAMSVLKGGHHASPSHQVQGRLRHRGLLSAMQRDLFKVSRHSFGHPVIGSCLHIKHKSVLASRRNSASDVPGWNSMLDGVRGTHCATPKKEGEEEKKKLKTSPVQTDWTTATVRHTNYSQALLKLFTLGCRCCLPHTETVER